MSAQPMTDWADETFLGGADEEICLVLDRPIDRATLRAAVADQAGTLRAAGLRPGGALAVSLPPSLSYLTTLLAGWRIGAQVTVLDHRLTATEVSRALHRLSPQVFVSPQVKATGQLKGFHEVAASAVTLAGRPAGTDHVLVQLSSGSTGPSKVIGRTAAELMDEVHRYTRIDGMPRRGERVVVLNSLVHSMGLIGGLLHGLHAGVPSVIPERMTAMGVLRAVAAGTEPTTVLGVPFHIELLAAVGDPPVLPQLASAVSAGELLRPEVAQSFTRRFGAPVGEVYGMTEMGVILADLAGAARPATGSPAPGIEVRVENGELLVRRTRSPYLGEADPARWVDGWLRTGDAAEIDDVTGVVRILGRLDSQIAVGGLKVDLTEVEHTLRDLPGVAEAVVVHDRGIEAYVVLGTGTTAAGVEAELAVRLAPFKLPQRLHVLSGLPRTATGKPVRDISVLRATLGMA